MKIFLLCLLSFLLVTTALTTQQPPASAPWDVTLQTNKVADSNLSVVNRCRKNHQFQIQLQNVPFLHLSNNQANVKGGKTEVLPVKFDTTNLAPGFYQGQVLVICATCKSEPTCTQDREVLQVNLTVTAETGAAGQPPPPSASPSTITSAPTSPAVVPTVAGPLDTQIVHVEGTPGGGNGLWLVKIKLQSGKIVNIFIRAPDKPALKYCDWIRIKTSHDEKGDTYVDSYDMTEDPTKKPTPTTTPKPTPTPVKPPTTEGTGPGTTSQPRACKEGEIRNLKREEKTFEFIDDDAQVSFSMSSTSDDGISAALGMADFWKKGAKVVKEITDRVPASGGGAVAVGLVVDYLDKGGDILEAVAKSKIARLNEGVSLQMAVTTYKVTVTCVTFEICENGKWVTKKRLINPGPERSVYVASRRAHLGDPERDKIEDSSRPQFLDPAKVEQWAGDFLKGELDKLKKAKQEDEEFVKSCK